LFPPNVGLIKRFEFTLELAWKVLKDTMQDDGIIIDKISPKYVIKQAYSSKYIDNVDIWLSMINENLKASKYLHFPQSQPLVKKMLWSSFEVFVST
jgi:nucleotidyltransferase substrate binding protein (TIGR01987 family)